MAHFATKTVHKTPYPVHSQADQTVGITGGGGSIGSLSDIVKANNSDASAAFDTNARANLDMTQLFFSLIQVSLVVVGDFHHNPMAGIYASSKAAFLALLHRIATQEPVEKAQMVSFDPVYSGQFAVWATSYAVAMLHGRFIHSQWDVDELQAPDVKAKIENDEVFLKMGAIVLRVTYGRICHLRIVNSTFKDRRKLLCYMLQKGSPTRYHCNVIADEVRVEYAVIRYGRRARMVEKWVLTAVVREIHNTTSPLQPGRAVERT
ncbi:hypothetical protein BDBG_03444 [Blastomyces gilchristii SLH14081]|uniref:Uncharacterized protein n=1 Tax=Blastomyces gilchristii (strain SLH14081) TaxID=559298 RepID=A0A179UHB0_BLAGS|nr:uncharacterized protein BDBG_03444 [Blastomyces gilchristii SLH14081]OAT07374.1 hypothetical protein BDBG_03444 [Blastomyces gilchristii SLH14081]